LQVFVKTTKNTYFFKKGHFVIIIGRTARNVNATVVLYADRVTNAMQKAIDETNRRRKIQLEYNRQHNITPETIRKELRMTLAEELKARQVARDRLELSESEYDRQQIISELEEEVFEAAEKLDFERAAFLRDRLTELKDMPMMEQSGRPRFKKRGEGRGKVKR
jgi:excinuclease ABC subunit B